MTLIDVLVGKESAFDVTDVITTEEGRCEATQFNGARKC
jgi:hypothetical protein